MTTAPLTFTEPTQWMHKICNRDGTNDVEVVNAYEKKFNEPLGRLPTASGRLRLDHQLIDRMQFGDVLLKVYRKGGLAGSAWQLKFVGPVLTTEESADANAQVVQYNAAGSFWYVMNRLLGKAAGFSFGNAGLLKKRTEIATEILQQINNDGFTGVALGTVTNPGEPSAAHYGPVNFSPAGEALIELEAAQGGYEWAVIPIEPTTPTGQVALPDGSMPKKIGSLNLVYPQRGSGTNNTFVNQTDVVFEWAAQVPQVASYKRTVSRDSLLTAAYALPPGYPTSNTPDTHVVGRNVNPLSVFALRGLIEGVVPTDLVDDDMRTQIADAHLAVRQAPRQLLEFTLGQNAVPRAFDQYGVGDRVRCRALINGVLRFDNMFRVWGIEATVDANGNESIVLELTEPT